MRLWREDAEARGTEGEFEADAGLVDLAVGVEEARRLALHNETGAAAEEDAGVPVEGAAEEAERERHGVEGVEGRNGAEVEQAVVGARAGSDAGIVAVLVGVGDGEGEGADALGAVVVDDRVVLRLGREEGACAGGEVAEKAAAPELIEALGDLGFEAESGSGEEGVAIGEAGIDGVDATGFQNREGVRGRAVDAEVAAEAVAGAAGDEAERGGGADERGGDFVHRAVAADGYDELAVVGERFGRERARVAGVLGEADGGAVFFGESLDVGQRAMGGAGAEVDDEAGFQRREV